MNRMLAGTILAAVGAAAQGQVIVGQDDFDGNTMGLINSSIPALDGGPGDYFGVGSRNGWPQGFPDPGVPFSLGDDTVIDYTGGGVFPGDIEGVYGQNSNFDNNFFAMVDSDEFGDDQTASWTFDIAGFSDLMLSVDFGGISDDAFGGYSPDTSIQFTAQIDGGATQVAFNVTAEEFIGQFLTRPMDNGNQSGGGALLAVSGDNAIMKFLAEDGSLAGETYVDKSVASGDGAGQLDTFMTALDGAGDELVLTMTANMPFEAALFDNIVITGVPAPGAVALLGLGGLALSRRRR